MAAVMTTKHKRVLWVDNQISQFDEVMIEMEARGHTLIAAESGAEAINAIKLKTIDLALIDLLMPEVLGSKVLEELTKAQPSAKAAVVTSYQGVEGIGVADDQVAKIEKIDLLSVIDSPAEAYDYIFEELERQSITSADNTVKRDVVDVTFEQYQNASQEDKRALLQVAKNVLQRELKGYFESGSSWVLFCGNRKPHLESSILPRMPSSKDLSCIGNELGKVPFLFVRPMHIDDVSWSEDCSTELRGYPTITFKADEGEKHTCHFDTGSPTSWADVRWFQKSYPSVDLDDGVMVEVVVNGVDVTCYHEPQHTVFSDQKEGYVTEGEISFLVVLEWDDFPLKRSCSKPCTLDLKYCKYRFALVGRDIKSKEPIILNLTDRTTTIEKK